MLTYATDFVYSTPSKNAIYGDRSKAAFSADKWASSLQIALFGSSDILATGLPWQLVSLITTFNVFTFGKSQVSCVPIPNEVLALPAKC